MSRNHSPEDIQDLSDFLQKIVAAPEFYFAEGDFLSRLEHACYYQLGNFQYPAKLLLHHFFKMLAEKFEVAVVVQDLQLKVVKSPVYCIAAEAAIMAQDTNHVIGPVDELLAGMDDTQDVAQEYEKTLHMLENFQPHHQGEILVSSPAWCKAPYLVEAVIYQFETKPITDEKTVRAAMAESLRQCENRQSKTIVMDPLGNEYNVLPPSVFVHILHDTLFLMAGELHHLKELVIAAANQQQAAALRKAIAGVLNISSFHNGSSFV